MPEQLSREALRDPLGDHRRSPTAGRERVWRSDVSGHDILSTASRSTPCKRSLSRCSDRLPGPKHRGAAGGPSALPLRARGSGHREHPSLLPSLGQRDPASPLGALRSMQDAIPRCRSSSGAVTRSRAALHAMAVREAAPRRRPGFVVLASGPPALAAGGGEPPGDAFFA